LLIDERTLFSDYVKSSLINTNRFCANLATQIGISETMIKDCVDRINFQNQRIDLLEKQTEEEVRKYYTQMQYETILLLAVHTSIPEFMQLRMVALKKSSGGQLKHDSEEIKKICKTLISKMN